MSQRTLHAVTGAFGYSGKYLARRLLAAGEAVITLTNSPARPHDFGDRVQAFPFDFDRPDRLARTLENVQVLYNTYWVRFNHRLFRHADAVRNTRVLFEAARRAGVERIVHVSITNPSEDSPLEYFRGKAELERALRETGVPYAILRPTVLFGREDILVNNIAWALRHLPVFGVFGDGNYRLQPIHVEDLAELAARYGGSRENLTIDAIGPETFTYRELAQTIRQALRRRTPILGVPKQVGYLVGRLVGWWVRDELVTWEEVLGLTANLLYTPSPPAGHTRLTDWIAAQAATLGVHYASELARRRDRSIEYTSH